ncbi:MAG: AAA family ATPase [Ardenticatenaceae bacterium]|nr:AAA family ATPase [Ardenticatenaceae bacterium]
MTLVQPDFPAFTAVKAERRVRACARCHKQWPLAFEYCRDCAIWVGGSERSVTDTWLVPEPAWVSSVAPCPSIRRAAGRPVVAFSAFLDCRLLYGNPQSDRELAEQLLQVVRTVVDQGGQPFAWPGQGLLVTFGWLSADELDPVHAIRGTLAVWQEARRVLVGRRPGDGQIELRMGLNVGLALTARPGARLPLEGESIDLARRLARSAPPGTIFCSPAIFAHGKRFFEFVGTGEPLWPEGKLPHPTFALLGERPATSHLHVDPLDRTPLVGRAGELDQIFAALDRARRGRTELVSLVAEPGTGKSKLIHEFLQRLAAVGTPGETTVLRGFGASYGGGPYWLLRGLLESLFLEGDNIEQRLVSLGITLESHHLRMFEALWTANVPSCTHVADAFRALLTALAARQPLLVVVDDLHWADDASLTVLGQLVEQLHGIPILLLFAYRPSGEKRLPWFPKECGQLIRLMPLTGATGRAFLSELVDLSSLSPGDVELLLARSRGNPLQLEETVALLGDRGRAIHQNGRWVIVGPLRDNEVPPTLHAAILARIDHLASNRVEPLQREASFIGRTAYGRQQIVAELEAIERQIGAWLDRLEAGAYADRAETGAYLHRLEQIDFELMMVCFLLGRPRPRNQRVAEAIERLYAGSFAEHFERLEVYLQRTGEAGSVADQAVRAGERAAALGDPAAAVRYYRLVIRLDDGYSNSSTAEVAERLGDLELQLGRAAAAETVWKEILDHTDEEVRWCRLTLKLVRAAWLTGRFDCANERLGNLLKEASGEPDVLAERAWLALASGDIAEANAVAEAALAAGRRKGSTAHTELYRLLAAAARAAGRTRAANSALRALVLATGQAPPTVETAEGYLALAIHAALTRWLSPAQAVAWARRAAALAQAVGAPRLEASALVWLGEANWRIGRSDEAAVAWHRAHELYRTVETVDYWSIALARLAQSAADRGDLEQARTWFQAAHEVAVRSPWRYSLQPWISDVTTSGRVP